jgi:hypothetical protein
LFRVDRQVRRSHDHRSERTGPRPVGDDVYRRQHHDDNNHHDLPDDHERRDHNDREHLANNHHEHDNAGHGRAREAAQASRRLSSGRSHNGAAMTVPADWAPSASIFN